MYGPYEESGGTGLFWWARGEKLRRPDVLSMPMTYVVLSEGKCLLWEAAEIRVGSRDWVLWREPFNSRIKCLALTSKANIAQSLI